MHIYRLLGAQLDLCYLSFLVGVPQYTFESLDHFQSELNLMKILHSTPSERSNHYYFCLIRGYKHKTYKTHFKAQIHAGGPKYKTSRLDFG